MLFLFLVPFLSSNHSGFSPYFLNFYVPFKSRAYVHFNERLLSSSTLFQKFCLEMHVN
jgi:hypothetical protein